MPIRSTTLQPVQNRRVHRAVLENGMVVLATENAVADIVAARFFFRAGSRYERSTQAGISHLLASVITKGTERLSSLEIAEQVESVGASLGADAATDYCLMSLKTVSADFAEMLELMAEILRSPAFPTAEVELERRLTLQGIRSTQEQPFAIAQQQLRRSLYQDHPYALPTLGVEETVSTLDRAALLDYHQTYFRPDNLVVSVTGCIDPEEAIALIDRVLGDWPIPTQADGTVQPLPELQLPTIAPQPHTVTTTQDTHQAIVMLGYLVAPVKDPDYAALKLLNTYLSNGLSSRLFVELREKQGLAYEVSGFYPTRLEMSQFVVYMGTAPGNTAIAVQGLKHEIDRLCTTQLTPEELQATKSKLLGQYALGKQTNAQIAQLFGWYEILELGLEFDSLFQEAIVAVTAEDAQRAAEQYFIEPYISLVGPEAAIDRALQAVS